MCDLWGRGRRDVGGPGSRVKFAIRIGSRRFGACTLFFSILVTRGAPAIPNKWQLTGPSSPAGKAGAPTRHLRLGPKSHAGALDVSISAMNRVASTYQRIRALLAGADLEGHLEPLEHVLEVERLRQAFRPEGDVKFLVLAESHVRSTLPNFARQGAGFIYEPRYYTPWWHQLLLPAFGVLQPTTADKRANFLLRLKQSGFWVLDVSLISLSGYTKVDPNWPNRPLDRIKREIFRESWNGHVERLFEEVRTQRRPAVICAFDCVRDVSPLHLGDNVTFIRFKAQGNSAKYSRPDYPFGTSKFQEAARKAELAGCLL